MHRYLDTTFGDDEKTKTAWVTRYYNMAVIELQHERHYRVMFTSQIMALKRLNELVRAPASRGRELYDEAARANPTAYQNFSYEAWMNFLISTGYVNMSKAIWSRWRLSRCSDETSSTGWSAGASPS